MCSDCHKYGKCSTACVSLMRVPKKDLTPEEYELVRSYESYARDNTGYGN